MASADRPAFGIRRGGHLQYRCHRRSRRGAARSESRDDADFHRHVGIFLRLLSKPLQSSIYRQPRLLEFCAAVRARLRVPGGDGTLSVREPLDAGHYGVARSAHGAYRGVGLCGHDIAVFNQRRVRGTLYIQDKEP